MFVYKSLSLFGKKGSSGVLNLMSTSSIFTHSRSRLRKFKYSLVSHFHPDKETVHQVIIGLENRQEILGEIRTESTNVNSVHDQIEEYCLSKAQKKLKVDYNEEVIEVKANWLKDIQKAESSKQIFSDFQYRTSSTNYFKTNRIIVSQQEINNVAANYYDDNMSPLYQMLNNYGCRNKIRSVALVGQDSDDVHLVNYYKTEICEFVQSRPNDDKVTLNHKGMVLDEDEVLLCEESTITLSEEKRVNRF